MASREASAAHAPGGSGRAVQRNLAGFAAQEAGLVPAGEGRSSLAGGPAVMGRAGPLSAGPDPRTLDRIHGAFAVQRTAAPGGSAGADAPTPTPTPTPAPGPRPAEGAMPPGPALVSPQRAPSIPSGPIARTTPLNVGRGPDMGVNDHCVLPGLVGGGASAMVPAAGVAGASTGLPGAGALAATGARVVRAGATALWEGVARGGAAYREHRGAGHVAASAARGLVDGASMGGSIGVTSSTPELVATLRRELAGVAGGEGTAVANRFAQNSSAVRVLGSSSAVSQLAGRHTSLVSAKGTVEREYQRRLVQSLADRPGGPPSAALITDPPYVDFGEGSGVLQAVLGGTRGIEVWATRIQSEGDNPEHYRIEAVIKVFDNFAFDPDDCYSPGLLAGAILQHYRGVHPFVHCVEVPTTLNVVLSDAPGTPRRGDGGTPTPR